MLKLSARFLISFAVTIIATYALYNWAPKWTTSYLVHWWLEDLPPLHGYMRIAAYGGIYLIAHFSYFARPPFGDSPLQAPELYEFTLKEWFSLEGAMKLLGRKWLSVPLLKLLRNATVLSFFCCTVGFGGRIPPIIVAIGMLLLHGVASGANGTNHRWYVPVYTSLALVFADGNMDYSVDAYLNAQFADYPFPPSTLATAPVLVSGFARKLVLTAGICTLFFGFITKVLNAGWAWMDGKSLAYYVSSDENGRSMFMKSIFIDYPWFSFLLSVGSLGFEAAAVLAIFLPWSRPFILASAAGLHFGIWLTMWPNYFPQTWCYGLGMSWAEPTLAAGTIPITDTTILAAWGATSLCIFLTMITLFRIEYWPLTGIPMYSFYRDLSFSYKHLRDATQAQHVAQEHINSGYPNALAWSNLWIVLRLKNTDPKMLALKQQQKQADATNGSNKKSESVSNESLFVNLKNRATDPNAKHGVMTKQWRRTLHNVAARDMSMKPNGHIEHIPDGIDGTGADYPGVEWLKQMLPILKSYNWDLPEWADKTGELQLRCKLKDGYAILAKIPWNTLVEDKKRK